MSSVKDLLRGNVVDGSGTANYIPKWSDTDTISTSVIYDNSTNVGIGTASPSQLLHLLTTDAASSGVGTAIQIESGGAGGDQGWIGVNKGTGNGLEISIENRDIIFNTGATSPFGGSEKLRILSGGGITFNGDTAAANALDDYEEGTWTPVINGTISNPTVNYGTNNGIYTKIGNIITISFSVSWSSLSGGNGQMIINGLPFVCKNNTPDLSHMGSFQSWNIVIPGLFTVPAVANNTTFMYFNNMNSGAAFNDILISHLSTGFGFFRATLTYFTD